jgi:hypothetical protein
MYCASDWKRPTKTAGKNILLVEKEGSSWYSLRIADLGMANVDVRHVRIEVAIEHEQEADVCPQDMLLLEDEGESDMPPSVTRRYRPPEVLLLGSRRSEWPLESDVWAAGCLGTPDVTVLYWHASVS